MNNTIEQKKQPELQVDISTLLGESFQKLEKLQKQDTGKNAKENTQIAEKNKKISEEINKHIINDENFLKKAQIDITKLNTDNNHLYQQVESIITNFLKTNEGKLSNKDIEEINKIIDLLIIHDENSDNFTWADNTKNNLQDDLTNYKTQEELKQEKIESHPEYKITTTFRDDILKILYAKPPTQDKKAADINTEITISISKIQWNEWLKGAQKILEKTLSDIEKKYNNTFDAERIALKKQLLWPSEQIQENIKKEQEQKQKESYESTVENLLTKLQKDPNALHTNITNFNIIWDAWNQWYFGKEWEKDKQGRQEQLVNIIKQFYSNQPNGWITFKDIHFKENDTEFGVNAIRVIRTGDEVPADQIEDKANIGKVRKSDAKPVTEQNGKYYIIEKSLDAIVPGTYEQAQKNIAINGYGKGQQIDILKFDDITQNQKSETIQNRILKIDKTWSFAKFEEFMQKNPKQLDKFLQNDGLKIIQNIYSKWYIEKDNNINWEIVKEKQELKEPIEKLSGYQTTITKLAIDQAQGNDRTALATLIQQFDQDKTLLGNTKEQQILNYNIVATRYKNNMEKNPYTLWLLTKKPEELTPQEQSDKEMFLKIQWLNIWLNDGKTNQEVQLDKMKDQATKMRDSIKGYLFDMLSMLWFTKEDILAFFPDSEVWKHMVEKWFQKEFKLADEQTNTINTILGDLNKNDNTKNIVTKVFTKDEQWKDTTTIDPEASFEQSHKTFFADTNRINIVIDNLKPTKEKDKVQHQINGKYLASLMDDTQKNKYLTTDYNIKDDAFDNGLQDDLVTITKSPKFKEDLEKTNNKTIALGETANQKNRAIDSTDEVAMYTTMLLMKGPQNTEYFLTENKFNKTETSPTTVDKPQEKYTQDEYIKDNKIIKENTDHTKIFDMTKAPDFIVIGDQVLHKKDNKEYQVYKDKTFTKFAFKTGQEIKEATTDQQNIAKIQATVAEINKKILLYENKDATKYETNITTKPFFELFTNDALYKTLDDYDTEDAIIQNKDFFIKFLEYGKKQKGNENLIIPTDISTVTVLKKETDKPIRFEVTVTTGPTKIITLEKGGKLTIEDKPTT